MLYLSYMLYIIPPLSKKSRLQGDLSRHRCIGPSIAPPQPPRDLRANAMTSRPDQLANLLFSRAV